MSEDWLYKWEVLAELDADSNYREDVVAEALTSHNGPLVRIALKVLRHHPDPGQSSPWRKRGVVAQPIRGRCDRFCFYVPNLNHRHDC